MKRHPAARFIISQFNELAEMISYAIIKKHILLGTFIVNYIYINQKVEKSLNYDFRVIKKGKT